jgi:hypothetical protein
MNARYKDGKIEFDLHDLLESVSAETKADMLESLACDDDIIKHVTDQIIKQWTKNHYSGGVAYVAEHDPQTGLDWAWRQVARCAGEVAEREIKRLEDAIRRKDKQHAEALEDNRKFRAQLGIYR